MKDASVRNNVVLMPGHNYIYEVSGAADRMVPTADRCTQSHALALSLLCLWLWLSDSLTSFPLSSSGRTLPPLWQPWFDRTKQLIEEGTLGTVTAAYVCYNIHHPESATRRDSMQGVIRQILTHHSYMTLYLMGAPLEVAAAALYHSAFAPTRRWLGVGPPACLSAICPRSLPIAIPPPGVCVLLHDQ